MSIRYILMMCVIPVLLIDCTHQQAGESSQEQNKDSMENINVNPSYIALQEQGKLKKRGQELWDRMESCDLCPRNCGARRLDGERGYCNANNKLEIASYGPHFGEEPELVGRNGSGTIFFTNCALKCVFCINADISQKGHGQTYSIDDLAGMMLELQEQGRHNINLVSPSHYVAHIILAIDKAAEKGLHIPIVYNTCGWEKKSVLEYLDGVVDIYLTDFKYGCNENAGKYSIDANNYVDVSKQAVLEMQDQTGKATSDPQTGVMQQGLMIRHLVMPNNVACTKKVMQWIGDSLPADTYVNIMSQYTPVFKAKDYPKINRRITAEAYQDALDAAKEAGLKNVHAQE